MHFFLDQDVYASTARFLTGLGHDTLTAMQAGLSQTTDSNLLVHAAAMGRVLVTRDRDFGGIVFVQGLTWGIIYLRMTPASVEAVHAELRRVLVFGEVRKAVSFLPPRPNVYHWRSNGGAEVDLLLERDGIFYPVEIRAKSNPSRKDTSGVSAFRHTYPHLRIEKGLVVAPCEKLLQLSENDYAMPWDAVARLAS